MLKLDILGHDDPKVIRMLQDITGIDPLKIPFDDQKTLSLFSSPEALGLTPDELASAIGNKGVTVGALGLPEYGTPFVRGMLEDTRPKNFSELVRISGFSHGTDVWLNNAQDLIKNGVVKLEDAISTRDDVMNYLIQHGVKPLTSFKVMENVRKGKGLEKGGSNNRAELDAAHVPQWFIDSCLKIGYLFPRAHAVAYVMMAFRIAWFKVYQPLAYYAAYFTIRAEGSFNAPVILRGLASMKQELARIAALDKPTAVEKEMRPSSKSLLKCTCAASPSCRLIWKNLTLRNSSWSMGSSCRHSTASLLWVMRWPRRLSLPDRIIPSPRRRTSRSEVRSASPSLIP